MNRLPDDIFPAENKAVIVQFLSETMAAVHVYAAEEIHVLIQPRDPAGHKGSFGHALVIAGSEGKSGASILCCKAALRTGCGLLTAAVPTSVHTPLLTLLPEAMTQTQDDLQDLSRFSAIGFGPGVGMEAADILLHVLQSGKPLVIDADGLTLLSQNQQWYAQLSSHTILTPHPKEFDRLTHEHESAFERLKTQIAFSKMHQTYVLLKGRYTSVTTPDGKLFFNTTGNSGMATAGSGDVLTGIVTSLLAQGYDTENATVLAAWLHGYAGDRSAIKKSETGLLASDIIDGIGEFFLEFEK